MNILLNNKREIIGLATVGGFVGGIDVENVPEEVINDPNIYSYIDEKFLLSEELVEKRRKEKYVVDLLSFISDAKTRLNETDYKALKYAEGFISDEDYESIRAERQSLRNEINRLELLVLENS